MNALRATVLMVAAGALFAVGCDPNPNEPEPPLTPQERAEQKKEYDRARERASQEAEEASQRMHEQRIPPGR